MNYFKFKIQLEDWNEGVRGSCESCVFANAIRRATKKEQRVIGVDYSIETRVVGVIMLLGMFGMPFGYKIYPVGPALNLLLDFDGNIKTTQELHQLYQDQEWELIPV